MSSNSQKTPLAQTLNQWSARKLQDALQQTGKGLPASVVSVAGAIVTVKFEIQSTFTLPNVTVPVSTSIYSREPIQVGDKGLVRPSDANLGGIDGLGSGTADLSAPANLSALVWEPLGNKAWPGVDPNVYTIQGPGGVLVRDMAANATIALTPTSIVLKVGSINITINGSSITFNGPVVFGGTATGEGGTVDFGGSAITTTADVTAGTISLKHHPHSGVTPGGGDTGPPVP